MSDTEAHWMELAKQLGIRLPWGSTKLTVANLRKWYHRLGMTTVDFRDWSGLTADEYVKRNPGWTLRATVGLMLEEKMRAVDRDWGSTKAA